MRQWLEITTTLPCINNCSYCPQKLLRESYNGEKRLTLDSFKKMLENVPKDVEIHFSAFSEPFGNRESSKMMEYAVNQGYETTVYSTLNGVTEEDIERIKDLPFKDFFVHIIDVKRPELPFNHDTLVVENPISRGGNLWEVSVGGTRCKRSDEFKQNVVLPNGDVYICCMDYGLKHKIGNIFEENFHDMDRKSLFELCSTCESGF
jgi:sulfatase maturation enzyme AslB (radical SAM superfamily)